MILQNEKKALLTATINFNLAIKRFEEAAF